MILKCFEYLKIEQNQKYLMETTLRTSKWKQGWTYILKCFVQIVKLVLSIYKSAWKRNIAEMG